MPAHRRLVLWLFSVAVGTNVPTPLLLVYRERLGLSAAVLTALFGVYAAGLVPALALAGPAADRFGRRRVALPAAALAGGVSLLFTAASDAVLLLFAARFLQGVVSGTAFSVGSAWLVETSSDGVGASGARRAAVAMTAGFSLGPLTSGLLGQYAPMPTVLPYLLHAAAVVIGLVLVWPVAETQGARPRGTAAPTGSPFRPGVLGEVLTVAAPVAVLVYAYPATAMNAVPLLVGLPGPPVAATGVLAGLTLGAGTLIAPLQARLGRHTSAVSAACGTIGFGLAALVAAQQELDLLLLPACLVLGAGGGLALVAGLARLPGLAREGRLATVSAAFYGCAYLGFAVPFVLASLVGPLGIVAPFGALAVLTALLAVSLVRRGG